MVEEIRIIKLSNGGEELIGTLVKEGKGEVVMRNVIRIVIMPPTKSGEKASIGFGDYVPYAFAVGETGPARMNKTFYRKDLMHPPMEAMDMLVDNYREMFPGIVKAPSNKIILPH